MKPVNKTERKSDLKSKKKPIFKKKKKFQNKKKTSEAIGKLMKDESMLKKQLNKKARIPVQKKNDISEKPEVKSEKKKLKRKHVSTADGKKPEAKKSLLTLKKKERKLLRKKEANPVAFERSTKLKTIWEDLRRENCEPEQQKQLLKQALNLSKGHVKELSVAHDTVRVLECVFGLCSKEEQNLIFEEIKDGIIPLTTSRYGKFLMSKIFRSGTSEQKKFIIQSFEGKVLHLIKHKESASVVELAFNEFANAAMRARLVQEFYGASFKYFKESECHSLDQLLKMKPELKSTVIPYMKDIILRVAEKTVITHSIVHLVLSEFMKHADPISRSEVIEGIRELVVEILHTKDGARAAMHCLWHGTAKDRKAIIKSFRTRVVKIAKEEFGHRVLLALFDCVDDTKLVNKHIIPELISPVSESNPIFDLFQDAYGKKVLLYLLCPRTTLHFDPGVINILKEGDNNATSKKDMNVRQEELKKCIVAPLLQMVVDNIGRSFMDNSFCFAVFAILEHTMGENEMAFRAIAEISAKKYSTDKVHIIESPGSHFMLKKLITQQQVENQCSFISFSEVLTDVVNKDSFQSWILCNRGCFLLSSLLETKIESVVQKIKDSLDGLQKTISKLKFKGAEVLVKKLKE